MSNKLGILHTTSVTVELLKKFANELLPQCEVINFVDDSILPQLAKNGGNLDDVEGRLIQYAKYAEQVGANVILSACSSVGEFVDKAQKELHVPILRIDDAMAEEAVSRGKHIGIAATLSTTMGPTLKLLNSKALKMKKEIVIDSVIATDAYKQLISGNSEAHDMILSEILTELAKANDVVVLAQASMSRVMDRVSDDLRGKFLTSPFLAMLSVKRTLERI